MDDFVGSKSPSSSTLLREPLLRGSAQTVNVRVKTSRSKEQLKVPLEEDPSSADSSPELNREKESAPKPYELLWRMPREVWVVLAIDFLNSYRSFGFRSVQYQFLTNEFGLDDLETGRLLGYQAWLLVIFGFLGAMLVDSWGVRTTALCALSVAAVSRGLLTFGRSKQTMLIALLGLSPFGEAVLSTGIYTVALKKLTTPETRSFAFGVQYGIFNFAGAVADIAADFLRQQDFTLPSFLADEHGSTDMSGLRMHVFVTWLAVLGALAIAYPLLHDAVVVPLDTPLQASPFSYVKGGNAPSSPPAFTLDEMQAMRDNATEQQKSRGYVIAAIPRGKPKPPPPAYAPSPIFGRANLEALKKATNPMQWRAAALGAAGRVLENTRDLCSLTAFWRALWLSVCLLFLSKQWGDLDQLLPPFLERHYGVATPIYLSERPPQALHCPSAVDRPTRARRPPSTPLTHRHADTHGSCVRLSQSIRSTCGCACSDQRSPPRSPRISTPSPSCCPASGCRRSRRSGSLTTRARRPPSSGSSGSLWARWSGRRASRRGWRTSRPTGAKASSSRSFRSRI